MTQAELIAALPEGRLPPALLQLNLTDGLLLFGGGLLLAALLSWLGSAFLRRPPSRRALIRATRSMPPEARALAIARILGHLPEGLRAGAYGSEPLPDDEAMGRIALKARRVRR